MSTPNPDKPRFVVVPHRPHARVVLVVVGVLWLLVLAAGPEPRHATRFAWFWLAFSPLVLLAVPAYLVLGARGAQEGRRRLTGGWAFLLTLVLNGAQEG